MLIQADASALEIRVAAFLSQDETLIDEILNGRDMHSDNQARFSLPTRLLAKVFNFRLLYGANEYSFANDPEFTPVSSKTSYWKEVIEAYYSKYKGIGLWHNKLIRQVVENKGVLQMPYGRQYEFKKYDGNYKDTQIKNYPVQGCGADLMAIARVSAFNRIKKLGYGDKCLFVNTVHDSIILDVAEKVCDNSIIVETLYNVFEDVPKNFEKLFGIEFNVPMKAECQIGSNWKDMEVT